jgi:hypothetical protein
VVGKAAEFLSRNAKDGVLVKTNGEPVTIGEVKGLINLWLAERGGKPGRRSLLSEATPVYRTNRYNQRFIAPGTDDLRYLPL